MPRTGCCISFVNSGNASIALGSIPQGAFRLMNAKYTSTIQSAINQRLLSLAQLRCRPSPASGLRCALNPRLPGHSQTRKHDNRLSIYNLPRIHMKATLPLMISLLISLGAISATAEAAGCLKGAAVGGVAGHFAGRHTVAGAAIGCAVGHHRATKKLRTEQNKPTSVHH